MIKCFEFGCDQSMSTTAKACPKCGFDLQRFWAESMESHTIGVPRWPAAYWYDWHLWYYTELCQGGLGFVPTSELWVNSGEPLFRYRNLSIHSPVSGLIVNTYRKVERGQDVGFINQCADFIEIRPRKGAYIANELMFADMMSKLHRIVSDQKRSVLAMFSKDEHKEIERIDPKDKFRNKQEMLNAIQMLARVKCVEFSQ